MTERHSATWGGPTPAISVVVATYQRESLLSGLVDALEAQVLPTGAFEVVIVDNGSTDGTWARLLDAAAVTTLRLQVVRLDRNRGPAAGRNAGVAASRAPVVAFTDDDCLPEPGWLEALLCAAEAGDVAQGRTLPHDGARALAGPWARTVWILEPTGLFETCNIAYRRDVLEAAGGFDEAEALTTRAGGRAFGEDAVLGARATAAGARLVFAPTASVRHRYVPGGYLDHVRERRQLVAFPALVRRSPPAAATRWHGVFLSRATAAFDLALLTAGCALAGRRRWPLLGTVPWLLVRWPEARFRSSGRPAAARFPQLAVADLVAAASLVEGSIRHRRLLV